MPSAATIQSPAAPGPQPTNAGWISRLWRYCWQHKGTTVLSGLAAIGGIGLGAFGPLLTKVAVDDATDGRTDGLGWVITGLIALALIRFGSSFLRRWAGGRLALDVQHDLRQDVFGALSRLDGAAQDTLRTGQVVSRATSDLQMIQGLLFMVPMSAGQVVMFVLSVLLMLLLSPLLTLTAVVMVPAIFLLTRATKTSLFPATWAAQQSAAEVADTVEENVTGVRVVKGFGQEERELGRLVDDAGRLYRNRMRAVRLTARIAPALSSMAAIGQVGVLALGGLLTINGSVSLGTFIAFSLYLAQLVPPTRMLSLLLITAQQARASVDRVLEIIDSRTRITDPPDPAELPAGPLTVRFEEVTFGYTADQPVLNGFDLTVPAGATVALVGASGSGKSTVSQLLPRFYDPQRGSISVGGVDLRRLRLTDLRRAVGVVFEEAFLFSDTIAANIGYGRPDATPAEIAAAAAAAEAEEFIAALPQGYQTVIGERGMTLSGGQRQRLALARAMLTDPAVLILDDATSAVDPATEAAIHQTLHRLTADRTTLLIAHRRSTLALADTIAVVVDGAIADVGTHAELLDRCAPYRALLGGDESDLDTTGSGRQVDQLAPGADGTTAQLWPDAVAGPEKAARISSDPMGHSMFGDLPATNELMDRVAALPPPVDQPPPAAAEAVAADQAGTRFSLRAQLRPFRGLLVLAVLLVALDAGAALAVPVLTRALVDDGVATANTKAVLLFSGIALLVVLADYFIQRGQQIAAGRAGEGVLFQLRIREFAHLQRLGLDYYEREMAGRIMTRMTTDVDALSSFLQTGLITSVVSLATFAGIAVVLVVLDVSLALLAFTLLPPLVVATVIFRRFSMKAYDEAREKVSKVNADLQENVSGMRITQAMGRQETNAQGFASLSDDYRRSRMRAQTAISLYFPFIGLLSELAAALVLGVGAHQVAAGTLTAGTLFAFVLYLDSFFNPIMALSQVFDSYQQAAVGLRRIGELLATPTSTPAAAEPVAVRGLSGELGLQEVGFHYGSTGPGAPPALTDIDLKFRPGETVAVVGITGAGKSTLVKLLARFYDPSTGVVSADGTDLRHFDLGDYRRRLGVVPQEPHLFTGTVADNIGYGRQQATRAEIEAAARAVGALPAIAALPGGFQHPVTERGRNLSAGQRQLISLARAELVDPDILLLDEATAALDPAAESAVLAATDRLARGRTTVVVAHRLTTASRADRIVVMDHGRIAETGTHHELLAAGGVYAQLYAGAH